MDNYVIIIRCGSIDFIAQNTMSLFSWRELNAREFSERIDNNRVESVLGGEV